jgi:DinB superfamily
MSPKDAIRIPIESSDMIVGTYINDLDDSDLLIRPVPGMNHIAWQLGHLIAVERHFIEMIKPGSCPELPAGFAEAHSKETATLDDPSRFHSRAKYQEPRRWPSSTACRRPISTRPTPASSPNGPRPSPPSWPWPGPTP